ncbi:MAG: hypothetical protein FGF51_03755 [Candidatus Brockarchaeota archaeon]|nr:hypothetical protein [Candidatus Brockarchaeota archaeon]
MRKNYIYGLKRRPVLNAAWALMIMVLLTPVGTAGSNGEVNITVVLKVIPFDPVGRPDFKVYVNGSSNPFGVELKVSPSEPLVFKVPKGSYLRISGELEIAGDYGFWYRLDSVNGTGRSIEFKADRDTTVYLNYTTNHLLTSPYFIAVYLLLALLFIRRLITSPKQIKHLKSSGNYTLRK